MKTKPFLMVLCLSIAGSMSCAQKSKPAANSPKGIIQSTVSTTTNPTTATTKPTTSATKPTTATTKQAAPGKSTTSQSTATPGAAAKPATPDAKKTPSVIEERTTRNETVVEIIPEAAPDSEIKKP